MSLPTLSIQLTPWLEVTLARPMFGGSIGRRKFHTCMGDTSRLLATGNTSRLLAAFL